MALVSMGSLPPGTVPERLALAGRRALENVCKHPGDRTVALDLLAADALITMALLAQSELDPAGLGLLLFRALPQLLAMTLQNTR